MLIPNSMDLNSDQQIITSILHQDYINHTLFHGLASSNPCSKVPYANNLPLIWWSQHPFMTMFFDLNWWGKSYCENLN